MQRRVKQQRCVKQQRRVKEQRRVKQQRQQEQQQQRRGGHFCFPRPPRCRFRLHPAIFLSPRMVGLNFGRSC